MLCVGHGTWQYNARPMRQLGVPGLREVSRGCPGRQQDTFGHQKYFPINASNSLFSMADWQVLHLTGRNRATFCTHLAHKNQAWCTNPLCFRGGLLPTWCRWKRPMRSSSKPSSRAMRLRRHWCCITFERSIRPNYRLMAPAWSRSACCRQQLATSSPALCARSR